jgi:hypothetical protein
MRHGRLSGFAREAGDVGRPIAEVIASRKFHPMLTKEFSEALTMKSLSKLHHQIAGTVLTFC